MTHLDFKLALLILLRYQTLSDAGIYSRFSRPRTFENSQYMLRVLILVWTLLREVLLLTPWANIYVYIRVLI